MTDILPQKRTAPKQAPTRHDPASRPVRGVRELNIKNADPTRHYVMVAKAGGVGLDVDGYLDDGFEVERYREGGPKLSSLHAEPGAAIEKWGHVLMSIDKQEWLERKRAEQEAADPLEKRIIENREGFDAMRGLGTIRDGLMKVQRSTVEETANG